MLSEIGHIPWTLFWQILLFAVVISAIVTREHK